MRDGGGPGLRLRLNLDLPSWIEGLARFERTIDLTSERPPGLTMTPWTLVSSWRWVQKPLCFVKWRNIVKLMREFMNITKALADERRVRALLALRQGELCVCQITELFGLAPSTISKHLSILFQAGLVESRKDGRWIYYQLPGKKAPVVVREVLDWIEKALADNPCVEGDNKQIKRILKQDPAELCKRQCRK